MTSVTSVPDPGTAPAGGTATAQARRLPSLTGLRWIAAMLVFGFHVGTMGIIAEPSYQEIIAWLFTLGLSGVQFFFILSGFVLVWSARPGERAGAFWRRRLAKIYPNHVVLWVLVVLFAVYWADPLDIRVLLANLFLVQAWTPAPGYFYSVNTVSWSLSCELFFYLCLPLALPLIRRMRAWQLWALVVAVPLLILALWPAQTLVPEAHRWWFTQVFPLTRSLEFWMGVAAAELMLRGRWRGPGLRLSSAIFVVAWVVTIEWIPAQYWAAVLAAVYVLVITGAADADVRGRWSPWRSRPMVRLGEISFAYYLVHVFLITTVLRLTGHAGGLPGWQGLAATAGFLLVCLLLAWLLFRFVETPMMRLLGPRRRPPTTPADRRPIPAPRRPGDAHPVGQPVR
ncbi:acyltransferase [Solwaraspora sp. WMMD1047]|uniref:acyltransferase family protein n=1 Tax=Solwaraspora sp. WMMD1047 TaxID=3016102 RepID=UPI0024170253|nr:acyltransferase [Solwaraspora sp. WMMD1047]MDG4830862.1 acyltransferase [Solwaraspora sp. WMMD1047]